MSVALHELQQLRDHLKYVEQENAILEFILASRQAPIRPSPTSAYTTAQPALPWSDYSFQRSFYQWEGWMGSQGLRDPSPYKMLTYWGNWWMYGISKHFHYWHRASMRGCERAAAAALLQRSVRRWQSRNIQKQRTLDRRRREAINRMRNLRLFSVFEQWRIATMVQQAAKCIQRWSRKLLEKRHLDTELHDNSPIGSSLMKLRLAFGFRKWRSICQHAAKKKQLAAERIFKCYRKRQFIKIFNQRALERRQREAINKMRNRHLFVHFELLRRNWFAHKRAQNVIQRHVRQRKLHRRMRDIIVRMQKLLLVMLFERWKSMWQKDKAVLTIQRKLRERHDAKALKKRLRRAINHMQKCGDVWLLSNAIANWCNFLQNKLKIMVELTQHFSQTFKKKSYIFCWRVWCDARMDSARRSRQLISQRYRRRMRALMLVWAWGRNSHLGTEAARDRRHSAHLKWVMLHAKHQNRRKDAQSQLRHKIQFESKTNKRDALQRQLLAVQEAERIKAAFRDAEKRREDAERSARESVKQTVAAVAAGTQLQILSRETASRLPVGTEEPQPEIMETEAATLAVNIPSTTAEEVRNDASAAIKAVSAMFKHLEAGDKLSYYSAESYSVVTAGVDIAKRSLWWQPMNRSSIAQRNVPLGRAKQVWWGRKASPTFDLFQAKFFALRDADELCFSLECEENGLSNWVDFAASSHMQLKVWFLGLQALIAGAKQQQSNGAGVTDSATISPTMLNDHLKYGLGSMSTYENIGVGDIALGKSSETSDREERGEAREQQVQMRMEQWMRSGQLVHFEKRFDMNRWMRWCFNQAADQIRVSSARAAAMRSSAVDLLSLVQEMLDIEAADSIRLMTCVEDFNTLRRLHSALLPLARANTTLDFVQFTSLLTTRDATEDANLLSGALGSLMTSQLAHGGRPFFDSSNDINELATVGLRLSDRIEVRMPVDGKLTASKRKWMWQECRLVGRASGRYFPKEAERFQAAVAALAAIDADGGRLTDKQRSERVLELERFIDRHTATQANLPGYRRLERGSGISPPQGLPLWEASFDRRQADYRVSPGTAQSALWGRYSSSFGPAMAQIAFLRDSGEQRRNGQAGQLWLRSSARGPRKKFGPVNVSFKLVGKKAEEKWKNLLGLGKKDSLPGQSDNCSFTLSTGATGETSMVVQDFKGKYIVTLSTDRCTVELRGDNGLTFTGPGLRKWLNVAGKEAADCKLVLFPSREIDRESTNEEDLREWVDAIELAQHPRYEWRRLQDQTAQSTIYPIEKDAST